MSQYYNSKSDMHCIIYFRIIYTQIHACSTEETFLQDFQVTLKRSLPN